jgi:hypothetical protein
VLVRNISFAAVGYLSACQSNETSDDLVTDDQKLLSENGQKYPAKDAIRNRNACPDAVNYVVWVMSLSGMTSNKTSPRSCINHEVERGLTAERSELR